jgi:hypothetical protein
MSMPIHELLQSHRRYSKYTVNSPIRLSHQLPVGMRRPPISLPLTRALSLWAD